MNKLAKKGIVAFALFGLILLLMAVFYLFFGSNNVTIGVSTALAILMYRSKNLTVRPGKNLLKLVTLNLLMGLVAFLSSLNVFIAVPINFVSLFMIAGALSYTISTPISTPFSLQYIFLIANPVSLEELPVRLVALIVGALFFMAAQMLINRNRVNLEIKKCFPEICGQLKNKIGGIRNHEQVTAMEDAIRVAITNFKRTLYESRIDHYDFTDENEIYLDLAIAADQFNQSLNDFPTDGSADHIFADLQVLLGQIKAAAVKELPWTEAKNGFEVFYKKNDNPDKNDRVVQKLIDQLALFKSGLKALDELNQQVRTGAANIKKSVPPAEADKVVNRYSLKLSINGLRLTYCLRLAFGISICAFVVDYFNLAHGSWILFTISAVTYPYYELTRQKIGTRILGTCLGGVLVIVIFSVLQLQNAGMIIMLVALFLTIVFMNHPIASVLFTTISAIGALALFESATMLTLDRIIYVIIGGFVVVLLSKLVLPYTRADAQKELLTMYDTIIVNFLKEIRSTPSYTNHFKTRLMNLVLITAMIEEKLTAEVDTDEADALSDYINLRRTLILNLYSVYLWLQQNPSSINEFSAVVRDIQVNFAAQQKEPDDVVIPALAEQYDLKNKVVIWECLDILRAMDQLDLIHEKA